LTNGSSTQGSNSNNAALAHQNCWLRTVAPVWVIGEMSRVMINESNTDLDLHTNQSLLGSNTFVIHDFDKPVNVVRIQS
jgi:hypothetical protein